MILRALSMAVILTQQIVGVVFSIEMGNARFAVGFTIGAALCVFVIADMLRRDPR